MPNSAFSHELIERARSADTLAVAVIKAGVAA
jgi:hypothetical protein